MRLSIKAAGCVFLLGFWAWAAPARAQGIEDFFGGLFAPPRPVVAPSYRPAPGRTSRSGLVRPRQSGWVERRGNARSAERPFEGAAKRRSRVRVAGLPDAGRATPGARREVAVPVEAAIKPLAIKPAAPNADPITPLLNDPTLRRGDIVVFPSGPKVFEGQQKNSASHRLEDFKAAQGSALLGGATRKVLVGMRLQPFAAPPPGAALATLGAAADDGNERPLWIEVRASAPRRVGP